MCGITSDNCYIIDLTMKPEFNKDEQTFQRNSTICSECKNKIIDLFSKFEDEYF